MDRGLGAIDAGRMEYPQFAGGGVVDGIVAFDDGGTVRMANGTPPSMFDKLGAAYMQNVLLGSPYATMAPTETSQALSQSQNYSDTEILQELEDALSKGDQDRAAQLRGAYMQRNRGNLVSAERTIKNITDKLAAKQKSSEVNTLMGGAGTAPPSGGGRRTGTAISTTPTTATMPTLPDTPDEGISPFIKMLKEAQKAEGIGGASAKARKLLEEEAAEEKQLTPEQKRLAGAQAGFAMAEAYSRRGRDRVSGLGGVAEAGKSYASSLQKINSELRDAARSRRRETIALDRADELQAAGNIQAAVNMRESAKADTFRRTELAVRQLESKLDRDLRMRLGMAQIGAQNMQTYATIKQKAIADYSDYVSNLSTDPRFTKLDEAQQNEFLRQAYERIVNSAVSDLGGGGGGSFPGFSLVNPKK